MARITRAAYRRVWKGMSERGAWKLPERRVLEPRATIGRKLHRAEAGISGGFDIHVRFYLKRGGP